MTRQGVLLAAVVCALSVAPAALGARPLSVGYDNPAALRELHVTTRIAPLHIAEVTGTSARSLRARPGIRWVSTTVSRRHLGTSTSGLASAEWQYSATRLDLVPSYVKRAAAAMTIAIVDTGADITAPPIAGKNVTTYNAVTGTDTVSDETGHGTFVTSVATGFGGDAKLLIVQANRDLDTFDDVDEAAGIVWAVDNGARVINLSIGGASTSQAEKDAIAYAVAHGVLLVAAAGNTGLGGNVPNYPAALLGSHGLAVAASTTKGTRASFSTAARYVSLAAPGVRVLGATIATSDRTEYPRANVTTAGLYAYGTGTSYAAPQVSGAAVLVWAANPSLTADQIVVLIEKTAKGDGRWNSSTGFGVLDVAAAVSKALRRVR